MKVEKQKNDGTKLAVDGGIIDLKLEIGTMVTNPDAEMNNGCSFQFVQIQGQTTLMSRKYNEKEGTEIVMEAAKHATARAREVERVRKAEAGKNTTAPKIVG